MKRRRISTTTCGSFGTLQPHLPDIQTSASLELTKDVAVRTEHLRLVLVEAALQVFIANAADRHERSRDLRHLEDRLERLDFALYRSFQVEVRLASVGYYYSSARCPASKPGLVDMDNERHQVANGTQLDGANARSDASHQPCTSY